MTIQEHVSLAPCTTFHIGGPARFFIEAESEQDVTEAISFAKEQRLPLVILGAGSNVLVSDEGVEGVVVKVNLQGLVFDEEGQSLVVRAGAGVRWDDVVDAVAARGVFGLENLAGIPGSLGGAAVQNIGAYGAELRGSFEYADTIDTHTGAKMRITRDAAAFGYRTSYFKQHRELIITEVALRCLKSAKANISYPDLLRAQSSGTALTTPIEIATAVRAIRTQKFPQNPEEGMAGSFFKNPTISPEQADELTRHYPGLPAFPQANGSVKVSLAWLLDHALGLKGFSKGHVRLYEKQPIVVVAETGARMRDVDAFATEISEKVFAATGVRIEREVETLTT